MPQNASVLLALLLSASGAGCGGAPAEPGSEPALEELSPPVGAERYREILREEAGVDVDPLELASLAAADAARIEVRMDALARAVFEGSAGGGRPGSPEGERRASPTVEATGLWREAFAELRRDHPEDGEAVLAAYRREVERARAFVAEQELLDVPEGPLDVVETPDVFPPGRYPLIAYLGFRLAVTVESQGDLANHCRVCIPPLAVHETYPGHHAAFLVRRRETGRAERRGERSVATGTRPVPDVRRDPATTAQDAEGYGGSAVEDASPAGAGAGARPSPAGAPQGLRELSAAHFKNRFFHEGWGQYAELLVLESGYYTGQPGRELGAWRNLLFRVERARVDASLHAGGMSPEEALDVLEAFVDRATARDELRRHLAEPTFKAAYYVGLLQVLELREAVRRADPELEPRELHHRLLRWPLPLPEAARLRFGVEIGPGLPEEGLGRFLPPEGVSQNTGRW